MTEITDMSEEEIAARRRNQESFAEQWGGDFATLQARRLWLGPSPDGQDVGFMAELADGSMVRFGMSFWHLEAFAVELKVAFDTCLQRVQAEIAKSGH